MVVPRPSGKSDATYSSQAHPRDTAQQARYIVPAKRGPQPYGIRSASAGRLAPVTRSSYMAQYHPYNSTARSASTLRAPSPSDTRPAAASLTSEFRLPPRYEVGPSPAMSWRTNRRTPVDADLAPVAQAPEATAPVPAAPATVAASSPVVPTFRAFLQAPSSMTATCWLPPRYEVGPSPPMSWRSETKTPNDDSQPPATAAPVPAAPAIHLPSGLSVLASARLTLPAPAAVVAAPPVTLRAATPVVAAPPHDPPRSYACGGCTYRDPPGSPLRASEQLVPAAVVPPTLVASSCALPCSPTMPTPAAPIHTKPAPMVPSLVASSACFCPTVMTAPIPTESAPTMPTLIASPSAFPHSLVMPAPIPTEPAPTTPTLVASFPARPSTTVPLPAAPVHFSRTPMVPVLAVAAPAAPSEELFPCAAAVAVSAMPAPAARNHAATGVVPTPEAVATPLAPGLGLAAPTSTVLANVAYGPAAGTTATATYAPAWKQPAIAPSHGAYVAEGPDLWEPLSERDRKDTLEAISSTCRDLQRFQARISAPRKQASTTERALVEIEEAVPGDLKRVQDLGQDEAWYPTATATPLRLFAQHEGLATPSRSMDLEVLDARATLDARRQAVAQVRSSAEQGLFDIDEAVQQDALGRVLRNVKAAHQKVSRRIAEHTAGFKRALNSLGSEAALLQGSSVGRCRAIWQARDSHSKAYEDTMRFLLDAQRQLRALELEVESEQKDLESLELAGDRLLVRSVKAERRVNECWERMAPLGNLVRQLRASRVPVSGPAVVAGMALLAQDSAAAAAAASTLPAGPEVLHTAAPVTPQQPRLPAVCTPQAQRPVLASIGNTMARVHGNPAQQGKPTLKQQQENIILSMR